MTQLLVALWLFQRRRLILSYALSVCVLATYESFYLPFLAAPLLCIEPARRSRAALTRHATLFLLVVGAVLAVRYFHGEQRAALLVDALPQNLVRILTAPAIGAGAALWALIARPIDVLLAGSAWAWLVAILAALFLSLLLTRFRRSRLSHAESNAQGPGAWLLVMVGAGALAISYLPSFRPNYYPPVMNLGRLSGVHAAGALGASLLVGALLAGIFASVGEWRRWLRPICALWLGLLVTHGIRVQHSEYATSWRLQVDFWKSIVRQSMDADEGTVVVLDWSVLASRTPGFVTMHSTMLSPHALQQWLSVPRTWRHPPVLMCFIEGYFSEIVARPDGVLVNCPSWWASMVESWPLLQDERFLLFRYSGGSYQRVFEDIIVAGRRLKPKPLAAPNPDLGTSKSYGNLIERTGGGRRYRFGGTCWHPNEPTCLGN